MAQSTERLPTHLYFADRNNAFLVSEQKEMPAFETAEAYGSEIVRALIKGPQSGLMPTLPAQASLLAFYILRDGVAVVDLSGEIQTRHPGGIQMERLSIYSIVNSLVLNIPGVKTVKILIDGRDALTLSGHVDLRFPLRAEMLLIR